MIERRTFSSLGIRYSAAAAAPDDNNDDRGGTAPLTLSSAATLREMTTTTTAMTAMTAMTTMTTRTTIASPATIESTGAVVLSRKRELVICRPCLSIEGYSSLADCGGG